MKARLLILSDMYGFDSTGWLTTYTELLQPYFHLQSYDCRALAGIDTTLCSEAELHSRFVSGGIATACHTLMHQEPEEVSVLAFSVGGTIAWQAGLQGLKIKKLYAVSATRLRHESQRPNCSIRLYYGEQDAYRPTQSWFETLKIISQLQFGQGHRLYRSVEFAAQLCQEIVLNQRILTTSPC